ncbi:MAG TPA: LuxR C-terminal-related transcriptional regulator, partial [Chitinophagaceae bacterium]|nr:LuxR C-terminal-related transcriptional regulator [Chitinophagaceae bacterium]
PAAKIIIFTMGSEDVFARRYLKAGVKGFLSKECAADEVATAIQTVLGDRKYLSEKLVNNLTNDKLEKRTDNPFQSLSNRQLEIAMLLIAGKTVSEISDTLNIQNSTVGTHKAHIFEKLQVDNPIDLRELARLYQII